MPTRDTQGPPAPELLEPKDGAALACPIGKPIDVTLRWSSVSDPSGIARYDVELGRIPIYAAAPAETTTVVQVKGDQPQTTISSACGSSLRWRVRAVDGRENIGEWSRPGTFRVLTWQESDRTPPPIPTPLKPGAASASSPTSLYPCKATLEWTAVSDPSGIQGYLINLQRYDYASSTWKSIEPYYIISETRIDVSRWLSEGNRYRWAVQARDAVGNQSEASHFLYFNCPIG